MPKFADNHDLIMALVPALDDIPESTEDQMPNEVCTCTHGDTFQYSHEDHTPGVGCERRWCTCTWWPTES